MHIVMFYHSLLSDWNHGNAHFLRGIASELIAREHTVQIYEPEHGWSLQNLIAEHGQAPIEQFKLAYPHLNSTFYNLDTLNLDAALQAADLVLVHEWNDHEMVRRLGAHRAQHHHYRLLFHDTHHRMVTEPASMNAYDLTHYDGVLAYGKAIADLYHQRSMPAWIWHEAADTRRFCPIVSQALAGDLVWVGNWGDEERTAELHEFLLKPIKNLGLKARVYGVRYPDHALDALKNAGIEYGGWLPNYRVPEVFAQYRLTVHIPRRPYVEALPGIPTIRPFEAMACGIPLISAPWQDVEHLFRPGTDYLIAQDGQQMEQHIQTVLNHPKQAAALAQSGLETIQARHTCAHRVAELLQIYNQLKEKTYA